MKNNTNIQLTGSTDVRNNSKKVSRLRLALAGTGVTSALLMGGLFGATGLAHAAPAHAEKNSTPATTLSARSSQMTTAPMSYNMNADYQDVARQAAAAAGISPDPFCWQIQQSSGFNPAAVSS